MERSHEKTKSKPHGKIEFENLAKLIGQRWQKLSPENVRYYKTLANDDLENRYKVEMLHYEQRLQNKTEMDGTHRSQEGTRSDKEEQSGSDTGEIL